MEKERKKDSLGALATFLVGFGVVGLSLWALAKSLGWVHSPTWVEIMPYFFGAGGLGGIAIYCGKVMPRLDRVEKDVEKVDGKVDEIIRDTSAIKAKIVAHDKQIGGLERDVYDNPPRGAKEV